MNKVLEQLLTHPRGRGTERQTWEYIRSQIPSRWSSGIFYDDKGSFMGAWTKNEIKTKTVFTCHLDTVERPDAGKKALKIDQRGIMTAHDPLTDRQTILGADDGAGIYVLLRLIEAGVPGLYLFFAGEESGGIGSNHLASQGGIWDVFDLRDYDRAIAFDRRGRTDVIDQQQGEACCSKSFSNALATALTGEKGLYVYAPTPGIYTDTAELTCLISECSNISVGYFDEHTTRECLDLFYLENLIDVCITLDWEALPTVREAKEQRGYDLPYATPANSIDDLIGQMMESGVTITDLLDYIKTFGLVEIL